MNKTLMASVFPGAKGKWWFASLVADAWPPDAREVELAFDGGLGTRLTRSIVKVEPANVPSASRTPPRHFVTGCRPSRYSPSGMPVAAVESVTQ